jgi:hypothetical protein
MMDTLNKKEFNDMMDTLNKNEFQTAGRGAEQDFWSWRFAGKMLGLPRKYNLQVHQLCVAAQIAHHHHHSEWGRLINAPDQVVIISVASSVEGQLQSIIKCASFILGFHGTLPRKRGFASACAHKLAYCMRAVDCMEAMGIGHRQLDPKNGISHRSSVGSQSTNSVRRGREEKPQEKPTQEQEEVREESEFREEVQARRCMMVSAAAVQGPRVHRQPNDAFHQWLHKFRKDSPTTSSISGCTSSEKV